MGDTQIMAIFILGFAVGGLLDAILGAGRLFTKYWRQELTAELWAEKLAGELEYICRMCEIAGDFRNGNTFQGIDEGQVMTGKALDKAGKVLAAFRERERKT